MTDFASLAAPGIAGLTPYVPGKPLAELERELGIQNSIKLASNENPLGPSLLAMAAVQRALPELARYPDGGSYALKQRLAAHHDIEPAAITLGNGSNDVLDMIARVFLTPERESVFSQYAFAVYPISTQAVGAQARVVPALEYGHDLDGFSAAITPRTGVVWIANPNNPTGTWLPRARLRAFLEGVPEHVIVVVDEAYIEYVDEPDYPDASRWLGDFPHLIVTRSFSKAYGLGGLRVGYALSHPAIADLLNRVRQPFNVTTPAQVAALAALDDQAHLQRGVELNRSGLVQLADGVRALGLGAIPSVGNFLTIDLQRPAAAVDAALQRAGVITRPIAGYGLPQHLRVSVGLPEENARFLEALATCLQAA